MNVFILDGGRHTIFNECASFTGDIIANVASSTWTTSPRNFRSLRPLGLFLLLSNFATCFLFELCFFSFHRQGQILSSALSGN